MVCSGFGDYKNLVRMYVGNSVLEKLELEGYQEKEIYEVVERLLSEIDFNDVEKTILRIYEKARKILNERSWRRKAFA